MPRLAPTWTLRALSTDFLKPKYHVTYIITSEGPKTFKVRYTCSDEVGEREATPSRTMRYVVDLPMGVAFNAYNTKPHEYSCIGNT